MTREELNQDKQQEIINEQKRERRKKITIFLFKISVVIIICFFCFYLYTTYVSSRMLSIYEHRVVDENIPNSFNGLKVVQLSDLHYGTTFFLDDLENVVNEINKRNVDLVFFTGDLIDSSYNLSAKEQKKIIKLFKDIDVSLGKYAIYGEEDKEVFKSIMEQSDFILLKNDYDIVYNGKLESIVITGTGSYLNNESNVSKTFSYFDGINNADIFTISLIHEPDLVDQIVDKHNPNLILAGHSHNGTVRLPYFGGLYKVDGALNYNQEYYYVNNSKLFISSGLGTNGPGFRLFCRPSINFFRLSNM